ncbi:MAG: hypothetical protein HON76_15760 [Candidatus Scalindua sp.]|jgi:hypothetical protein|nr:hypothetical protein [Candidatus Scalindua sp.]MBT6563976.1 hypothetical protein [Candidatus Scalindua sp.]
MFHTCFYNSVKGWEWINGSIARQRKLLTDSLSLTIGQARQELAHLLSREYNVQHAGSVL